MFRGTRFTVASATFHKLSKNLSIDLASLGIISKPEHYFMEYYGFHGHFKETTHSSNKLCHGKVLRSQKQLSAIQLGWTQFFTNQCPVMFDSWCVSIICSLYLALTPPETETTSEILQVMPCCSAEFQQSSSWGTGLYPFSRASWMASAHCREIQSMWKD